jgi:hypothetical protein
MKKKTLDMENMKDSEQEKAKQRLDELVREMAEGMDVPFGGPTEYYKFRWSRCKFENEMNEANVDAAYGWTKKRTRCSRGFDAAALSRENND